MIIRKINQILIYSHFYFPSIGGVETHTKNLAKLLKEKGYQLTIITQIPSKTNDEFRVIRKPSLSKLIVEILRHDLINMQGFNILVYIFSRLLRRKIIWYHHTYDLLSVGGGSSIYKGFLKSLEYHLRRNVTGVLLWISFHIGRFVAKYDKAILHFVTTYYMLRNFQEFIRRKNFFVLYHPVLIRQQFATNDGDYILFFGRLMAGKGEDILIRAIKLLKDEGIKIKTKILGPSPNPNYIHEMIKKLKVDDCVEYLGSKYGDEFINIISNSSIVVVPSTTEEMFGQTAIEAMAFSKPVIASNIAGLAEVVNRYGILVKPNDPIELAKAIKELYFNTEKRYKIGKEARKYVLDVFNPDIYIIKYIKIISQYFNINLISY